MLPARNRMRKSQDFALTIRRGRRVRGTWLVVYMDLTKDSSLVGFVVSRAVGNSVVRHRVARRLRHITRDLLKQRNLGYLVVRALPAAAEASSSELSGELTAAVERLERKETGV